MLAYFFYDDTTAWAKAKAFNPLGGAGAVYSDNRWNVAGHPMLYTSQNAALAMWEVCVHTGLARFGTRKLVEVSCEGVSIEEISPETVLSLSRGGKTDEEKTQQFGSEWLRDQRSLVLAVPSVVMPFEYNYIFNPLHPEMSKVQHRSVGHFTVDQRFLKNKRKTSRLN